MITKSDSVLRLVSSGRIRLKLLLKSILFIPGLFITWIKKKQPGIRVLFYHRVNPYPFEQLGPISCEITITPEAFEEQLAYLKKKGFRSVSPADLIAILNGRQAITPNSVLITFDDGYEDNALWAAPLLSTYGFQAIIFVITDFIGKETREVWKDGDPAGYGRFLTWEQIQQLANQGVGFASHTCSHPALAALDDLAISHELERSYATLASNCSTALRFIAYPGGDFNHQVEKAVLDSGYAAAFTTIPGLSLSGESHSALRRTEISASDNFFLFRMKMLGALDWMAFKESPAFRKTIRITSQLLLRVLNSK